MKFETVDISSIQLNSFNPNIMSEKAFKHLKEEIQRIGLIQPLLVRLTPEGSLELVDGEHRFKACMELGIPKVPVYIAEEGDKLADIKEAMITTINLKSIQGKFNPVKYAGLLNKLEKVYAEESIQKYLDVTSKELKDMEKLLTVEEAVPIPSDTNKANEPIKVFKFNITGQDNKDLILQALNLVGYTQNKDQALIQLCKEYLEMKEYVRLKDSNELDYEPAKEQ